MSVPSINFTDRLPQFEEVFQSGAAPYTTHIDALTVFRLLTGVEFQQIQPCLVKDGYYRGAFPGASGLYVADNDIATAAEVLGKSSFTTAPSGSYLLEFVFSGNVLMVDKIPHSGLVKDFLNPSGHECSQDFRLFLEQQGLLSDTAALAWPSVASRGHAISGRTLLVLAPDSGSLRFIKAERVDIQL